MNNELSNGISLQGQKARCDAQCKKVILAWILKHTTDEFSKFSIEEVMGCIEGEPEIGSVPVNFSGREEIDGLSNESNIVGEGVFYLDLYGSACIYRKCDISISDSQARSHSRYSGYAPNVR